MQLIWLKDEISTKILKDMEDGTDNQITDKETDESWNIFIIWKINSGLFWAAGPYLWKKSLGLIMSNFWGSFFYVFMGKIFFWKYCSVRTKKMHWIKVKKSQKKIGKYFYGWKTSFFRAKNFNKTNPLWSVLCWLLL